MPTTSIAASRGGLDMYSAVSDGTATLAADIGTKTLRTHWEPGQPEYLFIYGLRVEQRR